MYDVFILDNGTFECHGRLQDGTERWSETSLECAIKSLKGFAKSMNGSKIKKSDIKFYRPVFKTVIEWIETKEV